MTKKTTTTRKPKTVTVTSPVDPSLQIVVASEMADDAMIEQDLMGEVLPYFIYQFEQKGSKITGLTVKGVSEVVRRLNRDPKSGYKIRISPEHIRVERDVEYNGEKGVEVSVYAEDLLTANGAWGIKFEPYMSTGRNGQYKNTFAVEKAISKAERNAKRKLIPEQIAVKMIEKLLKEPGTVKQLQPATLQQTAVRMSAPVPSSPEALYKLAEEQINKANTSSRLLEIDSRVQERPEFSKEQKDAIHKLVSSRVDLLDAQ